MGAGFGYSWQPRSTERNGVGRWVAFLLGPCPGSRPACLAVLTSPWLDSARQAASPRGCESYWPTSRITPWSWSTTCRSTAPSSESPQGRGAGHHGAMPSMVRATLRILLFSNASSGVAGVLAIL